MPVTAAWYALAVLCIAVLLSQLDRNLTAIIVSPLKDEFGISDTQFGLLHGYAFALTYAVFGVPFGRLVDRRNRRNIILFGLLAWSVLTMLSAFAVSYTQLLLLRTGVGIGEAVLGPAAYSLIIDFFEPKKRGRATSIYYMAGAVGGGGSLLLGGLLLNLIPPTGMSLAGLGSFEPWRLLFLFAGVPGILGCLIVLTIREPQRTGQISSGNASIGAFFRFIWTHKALLIPISVASTLAATAGYGAAAWLPTLFERRFGVLPESSAGWIGGAIILGSVMGTLVSGAISDRQITRGKLGARTRPMLFGYIALLPATFIGLTSAPWMSVLCLAILLFFVGMVQTAAPLALQELVPANMRGQIVAVQFLVLSLCGIGLGPFLVGVISDSVFRSDAMLGWSLLVMLLPISLVGIAITTIGLSERAYQLRKPQLS